MEAHCVNLELKYQNHDLKSGKHSHSLNETSNKVKIKNEIDVLETINIEPENSVAKLLAENEKLHKQNTYLKQTYKDLYDFIKKTRVQTKDLNDSLIAQVNSKTVENADLKAKIQENVFVNATLKNELRKLKGNSVDTKFGKSSILGKPFASQVNVKQDLLKPVTPHYLPKVRESVFVNPHHMIAPGLSRNSSKNHMVNSLKSRNNIKPVEKKSNVNKPERWISNGYRLSPNKSFAVYEKTNTHRYCLRWKLTCRIFKTVLRFIPTGKIFTSSTTKVDSEPPNGSNEDITNPYECEQTLNVSAGTLNLSVGPALHEMTPGIISSRLVQNPPPTTPYVP
ncbi:hypothetical protein Tco_1123710 [Tanacetum coccineum]|uniref:Uncharacterized protein n=1 Tax=Tanacetum coccineum TaxID=301880 RepID=A0ABQ5J5U3_9ASTR